VFFLAQEILVDLSAYPTAAITKNAHDYRPLGLGYANLGTLLMRLGLPYDSDGGRAVAAALTAIMCGHAYRVSAEVAGSKGPFAGFPMNREPMLRVMRKHRDAAHKINDIGDPGMVGDGSARAPQNLLAAHVSEPPEHISKRRGSLPPALAVLVMRCLEKRPADRLQSAADIVHAPDAITTPSGGTQPTSAVPSVSRSVATAGKRAGSPVR
jgi:hypothetical protein